MQQGLDALPSRSLYISMPHPSPPLPAQCICNLLSANCNLHLRACSAIGCVRSACVRAGATLALACALLPRIAAPSMWHCPEGDGLAVRLRRSLHRGHGGDVRMRKAPNLPGAPTCYTAHAAIAWGRPGIITSLLLSLRLCKRSAAAMHSTLDQTAWHALLAGQRKLPSLQL